MCIRDRNYYYADCLWLRAEHEENQRLAAEKWKKTAIAFTDVVKSGKLLPKNKKEHVDSADAMLQAWKNNLAVDPTPPKPQKLSTKEGEIPKPKPIPESEQKLLSAFDNYEKYVKAPNADSRIGNRFIQARTLWKYDHLDKSLPIFTEIVEKHPDHETAPWSASIVADSYFRLQRYDEHNKFVGKMLKNEEFMNENPEIRDEFVGRRKFVMRKESEKYEKNGDYLECGNSYADIYNLDPEGDDMDEVLYNAGVCYEDGNSIGQAINFYSLLGREYPKSKLTQKALVRIGNAYGAIAFYEKAAEKYEEFAAKYSGEKDAPGALQNAVTYRKGIGQDAKAIKDIDLFVKKYKGKKRKEAAEALWGLTGIYEKQGNNKKTIEAYKKYMREIGKTGGRDRLVAANARIGEILWKQSCRTKSDDGSCVRVTRERATRRRGKKRRRKGSALPKQCGPASKIKLVVVDRDKRLSKEAQKYFRTALSEAKKGGITGAPDDGRKAVANYWNTASKFYLAEEEYETFLDLDFPRGLQFPPNNPKKAKESLKKFANWQKQKESLGAKTTKKYEAIRNTKRPGSASWEVASAARIGQITQNFADGLYTAEVPEAVRTGPYAEESWDVYCDTLTTVAEPLEKKSLSAYGFCLDLSTKLNWFNDWSRLCEKELGQIRPQDYPQATELHATAEGVSIITDTQNLISTIRDEE